MKWHVPLAAMVLCGNGIAPAQQRDAAPRPDDGVIYALALNYLFSHPGQASPGIVVLRDSTSPGRSIGAAMTRTVASATIDTSAVADFTRRTAAMFSLRGIADTISAHLLMPMRLMSGDTLRAIHATAGTSVTAFWSLFYERYPGSIGTVSLSPIGYSSSGNQAVLNVDHGCGGLCGEGNVVLLERVNGRWIVRGARKTWMS